jgi:hypothetical protein
MGYFVKEFSSTLCILIFVFIMSSCKKKTSFDLVFLFSMEKGCSFLLIIKGVHSTCASKLLKF